MIAVLFVLAAALGGVGRYVIENHLPPTGVKAFPTATLLVNVVGSFLLGLVMSAPHDVQLIAGTAFCGALTTFSGVSLQLQRRIQAQDITAAFKYVTLLLAFGLSAAWAGMQLSSRLFS